MGTGEGKRSSTTLTVYSAISPGAGLGAAMATSAAGAAEKPHAVFFPFPMQGHVKPALQFAKLLHHCHGFQVTFVHTEHNRRRLLRSRGPGALAGVPGFRFAAVPDGLSPSDVDALQDIGALLFSLETSVPHFRDLVAGLPPVTCVVSDIEHILRAAKEIMGIPCVTFWTASACAFLACQQFQHLIHRGIIPIKEVEQLTNGYLESTIVDWAPGMPKDMRLRDFPTFIRTTDPHDALLNLSMRIITCHRTTASAVIFHTFDELERDAITALSTILSRIYVVGPLPLLHGQFAGGSGDDTTLGSNLSEENHACLEWLAGKRANSVVYVSFGSIATPTNEQLVELAWGLANSKQEFLWIVRKDQGNCAGGDPAVVLPPEFLEETKERGYLASWCPQDAVLRHEAVGAFLTHCGWNSVVESISAGVPMLCWPFAADQQTNSRYACSEWRIGLEISVGSGDVSRDEVEETIREVMEGDKGKEMRRMATEWKEKAAAAAALPGGPSWVNLEKVVNEVLIAAPLVEKLAQI